jgi:uncharacterized membrane protein YkgB
MVQTARNDTMNQINQLILYVSMTSPFRSGLDRHLIRAAMVFTFFAFSIQKWNQYTIEMLVPLISHSPVVFWLLPAFGDQRSNRSISARATRRRSLCHRQDRVHLVHAQRSPTIPTGLGAIGLLGWRRKAGHHAGERPISQRFL